MSVCCPQPCITHTAPLGFPLHPERDARPQMFEFKHGFALNCIDLWMCNDLRVCNDLRDCNDPRECGDLLTRVSEMDAGGDAATPGPPNATTRVSEMDAGGDPWLGNTIDRDAMSQRDRSRSSRDRSQRERSEQRVLRAETSYRAARASIAPPHLRAPPPIPFSPWTTLVPWRQGESPITTASRMDEFLRMTPRPATANVFAEHPPQTHHRWARHFATALAEGTAATPAASSVAENDFVDCAHEEAHQAEGGTTPAASPGSTLSTVSRNADHDFATALTESHAMERTTTTPAASRPPQRLRERSSDSSD